MKTAIFTNFSSEPFTCFWDGKGKTVAAGESIYMPDSLARHFAKHLVNRELVRVETDDKGRMVRIKDERTGNLVPVTKIPGGETATSPKNPEQVPLFMDLFNRAYQTEGETEEKKNDLEAELDLLNKQKKQEKKGEAKEEKSDELVTPTDEEDDESNFPSGQPQE